MGEVASILIQEMIKSLLCAHALANMHRASGNEEYRKAAAEWLPTLEGHLHSIRRELTREKEASSNE